MAKQPLVYNLFWLQAPWARDNPAPVSRVQKNRLTESSYIPAVILYPSFTTPAVLAGDAAKLEILLLTKQEYPLPYLGVRIKAQLKVSSGFDPLKSYTSRLLFVDESGAAVGTVTDRTLSIQKLNFAKGKLLATESGSFSGYVDKRAFDAFQSHGYKVLYRVSMSAKCLQAALGSCEKSCNAIENGKTVPKEPQDEIIAELLKKRNPDLVEQGKYCFKIQSVAGENTPDVDLSSPDFAQPVQSWHPVFHYHQLDFANLGHVADIHVSARQQILKQSRARVIDVSDARQPELDADTSPPIGRLVNVCSQDLAQILAGIGGSEADMLLVGGDLIDFIRNAYLSKSVAESLEHGKPSKVWDALKLDKSYTRRYKDFIDLISFYTLLLDFCARYQRPAFLISGNHDCYLEPFGISPRILARKGGTGLKRANEGIPADHNLTFYEAILAFGDTYDVLKSTGSPFEPDLYAWLYTVFTPFADYSVQLPKQYLLGFAWGDSEDLFDAPLTGHGFGHLPRSKDGISAQQMSLLTSASGKGKKVIVFTHFTFISYAEKIPMSTGNVQLGDVYFDAFKNFEDHNLGTFNSQRTPMFETHLGKRKNIQLVLSGHSHRRGLYLIDRVDYSGRNSVKTRYFDFSDFEAQQRSLPKEILEPVAIVSDSGGTIPRYNRAGEFSGWGSDQPSGTTVLFDQSTGSIRKVGAVRASCCKPRLPVALDYLDVYEGKDVITRFESVDFAIADETRGKLTELVFHLELNQEVARFGIAVEAVSMYTNAGQWRRIQLTRRQSTIFAIGRQEDVRTFCDYMAKTKDRNNFLAIKFTRVPLGQGALRPSLDRYDFNSWWCFEFQVDFSTSGRSLVQWAPTRKQYVIERDKKRAEIPDFNWRRKKTPSKYA